MDCGGAMWCNLPGLHIYTHQNIIVSYSKHQNIIFIRGKETSIRFKHLRGELSKNALHQNEKPHFDPILLTLSAMFTKYSELAQRSNALEHGSSKKAALFGYCFHQKHLEKHVQTSCSASWALNHTNVSCKKERKKIQFQECLLTSFHGPSGRSMGAGGT